MAQTAESSMTGRPSGYSDEIAAEICSRIAEGKSLRAVCRASDMPAASTVFLWLKQQDGFSEQYARACEDRAHALAEEALEIADDPAGDVVVVDGVEKVCNENVQRSRLRVDTRKWFASKLFPRRYGDKIAVGGDETGAPLVVTWATGDKASS